MSFNLSFEIIEVVLLAPDPTFLCIKASVKLEVAVRPNNPNGLAAAFNNGNPDFNNGAKNLKNPPFYHLVNCAFDNLISADVWTAKLYEDLQLAY